MNVNYVFENQVYLITNRAVARNPLFNSTYYSRRFKRKMREYLDPICDLLAFQFKGNEYQIMVELYDKKRIHDFFFLKQKGLGKKNILMLPVSYIFSQQMANLQSSAVIHFNRREERSGALFASRFKKELIVRHSELVEEVDKFDQLKAKHHYSENWKNKDGFWSKSLQKVIGGVSWISSTFFDRVGVAGSGFEYAITNDFENELQGHFQNKLKIKMTKKDFLIYLSYRHKILII